MKEEFSQNSRKTMFIVEKLTVMLHRILLMETQTQNNLNTVTVTLQCQNILG